MDRLQSPAKASRGLAAVPGRLAHAITDTMRGRHARALTPGETKVLRGTFGDSIDLGDVRIVAGPGYNAFAATAFNIGGNPALTAGNTVYVRADYACADLSASPAGINTLAHEFGHVRQYQQLGFARFLAQYARDLLAFRDRNKVYDYASRGGDFASETIEGQAQMIGDYAEHRAGGRRLRPDQARSLEAKLHGTGICGL